MHTQAYKNEEYLISHEFIEAIEDVVEGTAEIYKSLDRKATMYVCISIYGCKGYWNYEILRNYNSVPARIDRDRILCEPIEIKDISDTQNVEEMIEECKKITRYALGMR
jgi:hypothetical protein